MSTGHAQADRPLARTDTATGDGTNQPSRIALDAARKRLKMADDAGVLDLSLDTAQSIQAKDSIEKMLCDQLGACHFAAMRLIQQASLAPDSIQMARLVTATARMMEVFQQGVFTLHRLRTGGRQVVTVQYVAVQDGGKAMVAGNVNAGGRGRDADEGG